MKTSTSISSLAACVAVFALSSCVVPMDDYPGGGYSGGGYSGGGGYGGGYGTTRSYYSSPSYAENDFYYYDGGAYPSYYNRGYGSYSAGYSYYRGSSVCPICHHSPCSGHSGHSNTWSHTSSNNFAHHDNDDHHSSSSHSNGSVLYQHTNADRNPGAPQGAHTKEWFTSHGYSPARLEKTDDHGHSTKKNDHDDDDKKHHHH